MQQSRRSIAFCIVGVGAATLLLYRSQYSVPKHLWKAADVGNSIIILEWTTLFGEHNILDRDPDEPLPKCAYKCVITDNRNALKEASAVVFHPRNFKWDDRPHIRYPWQRYIYYSRESPWSRNAYVPGGTDKIPRFWNWTMTYRLDSDVFSGYLSPDNLEEFYVTEKDVNVALESKNRGAAWIASNCEDKSGRLSYVAELKKYFEVTVFGKCLNGLRNCSRRDTWCIDDLKPHYDFYLSFENAICRYYATEKLVRPLEQLTVPIVLSRSVAAYYLPDSAFIAVDDFNSARELADHLKYLVRNKTAYAEFFAWRIVDKVPKNRTRTRRTHICQLCKKLHEDKVVKFYKNMQEYIAPPGCCRSIDRKIIYGNHTR